MSNDPALADYERFDFEAGPWVRPVYRRGRGPAVIIIHEMPGLHPLVVRFADRVVDAGMTVFLPSLFGVPGKPVSVGYAIAEIAKAICVRREFSIWAQNRSSPIVDWLRALARSVHAECGGKGVGAVGMCFTGNFALAMMTEPVVTAPVMSQPSLPLGRRNAAGVGLSPEETACVRRRLESEDLKVLGLRFRGDPVVPDARFQTLRETYGDRFEAVELEQSDGLPFMNRPSHSVLTINLVDDDPEAPTKAAERRVIEFFRTGVGA